MVKKPTRKIHLSEAKNAAASARYIDRGNHVFEHVPVWHLKLLDIEHPKWGWRNIKNQILFDILSKLKHYETRKWKEIFQDKHRDHSVQIDQLDKAAQRRLEELGLDDYAELFRLRLNGKQRIWGILEGYIFKIIWWDPEHTVCLSRLKHT